MKLEEYLLVEGRIAKERSHLSSLEQELAAYKLYPRISARTLGGFPLEDTAVARIVGSSLHDYYTAIENIFRDIAARIDKSMPQGEQWHKSLLEQMTLEVPGLRPSVISPSTAEKLDYYRAFRHVFRNVYGFHLSFARMKELLERLPDASSAFREDLDRFIKQMRSLYGIHQSEA
ncbi:MAG TPA: hypothetical protein GX513_04690 [Firmicutes bacterium]|nr:hypothetical protein [Bacillota bacterium]